MEIITQHPLNSILESLPTQELRPSLFLVARNETTFRSVRASVLDFFRGETPK